MPAPIALKEWSILVEAVAQGQQLLLVRKGGIRDPKGAFQLEHREFLLYPTLEHQNLEAVRPEFRERFRGHLSQPQNPAHVTFGVYAGVSHVGEIRDPKQLEGLEKYHLWTPEFFVERLKYRPQSPTVVVVIRGYRLKKPIQLPVKPEYIGCKSWVSLDEPISLGEVEPVMEDQRFRKALNEIAAKV